MQTPGTTGLVGGWGGTDLGENIYYPHIAYIIYGKVLFLLYLSVHAGSHVTIGDLFKIVHLEILPGPPATPPPPPHVPPLPSESVGKPVVDRPLKGLLVYSINIH